MKITVEMSRDEVLAAIRLYLQTHHGVTPAKDFGFAFEALIVQCEKYFPPSSYDCRD